MMAELPGLRFGIGHGAAHPDLNFVNVTSLECSPERALQVLLDFAGCKTQDLVAFGDGDTDIPVLKAAGLGIAMGNARRSVKDAADYVTKSVEENGVAEAINLLIGDFG